MRGTSLLAYRELQPKLSDRHQTVLVAFHAYPCSTDLEIAYHLGFKDPNKVRPRRKELVDLGLIVDVDVGVRECKISGKKSHIWSVTKK